jgi:hypothetical protein
MLHAGIRAPTIVHSGSEIFSNLKFIVIDDDANLPAACSASLLANVIRPAGAYLPLLQRRAAVSSVAAPPWPIHA